MYNEYISFCGLAGSRSVSRQFSLDEPSAWKPFNRVGLVGKSVRISHTLLESTWALRF
jgi:hypothetical protein